MQDQTRPMLKMIKTLIIILCMSSLVSGQFSETISSGRPGQAISGNTVGKSVAQIQTGLQYSSYNSNFFSSSYKTSSTVLRIGILEKVEINGVFNFANISTATATRSINGVSNTEIGARINLIENMGWISSLGLQGRILLKAQSTDFQRQNIGTTFTLATGHQISDRFAISTNWGVYNSGYALAEGDETRFHYILNAAYSINNKLGCFAEVYGDLKDGSSFFDGGISYLVSDDLQLDASTGWLGQEDIDSWFVDFGVSWRLRL